MHLSRGGELPADCDETTPRGGRQPHDARTISDGGGPPGDGERTPDAGATPPIGRHDAAQPSPGSGHPSPDRVRRAAVVGAGLIGSRWAALFLAAGLRVSVADPAAGTAERLRADVLRCLPALARLGLSSAAAAAADGCLADLLAGLTVHESIATAVGDAEFVQESVADDERLKRLVLAEVSAACPAGTVIASSTSGIVPTSLQSACSHPERVLVGHPFNPAHIIPLVEVVAGEATADEVVEWTMAFYTRLGKRPLRVRKEAPGFVSNRMQEAIWREMFHLVDDGIATTAELDAAITDGPGLRWALYGPAFIYMLQGGRGGFAYALEQFDPQVVADCSHNTYPELTSDLKDALDRQTREQAAGRSLEEWEALRDEFLLRLIELKRELFGEPD